MLHLRGIDAAATLDRSDISVISNRFEEMSGDPRLKPAVLAGLPASHQFGVREVAFYRFPAETWRSVHPVPSLRTYLIVAA